MSADEAIRPRDVPFRQVGEGLSQTFQCGQCQKPKLMAGRKLQLVKKGRMRGMRDHLCTDCQQENAK